MLEVDGDVHSINRFMFIAISVYRYLSMYGYGGPDSNLCTLIDSMLCTPHSWYRARCCARAVMKTPCALYRQGDSLFCNLA